MSGRPDIFVMAGEPSGDLIGALLIRRLLQIDPNLSIVAVGGEQMQAAGAELRFNIVRDLAIIGIVEVFTKFRKIARLFFDTVDYLRRHRPRVLVLIDYPGFNLRLAERAHGLGIKVVYYVIPQIWAWHRGRVHKIKRYVDQALVVFPFEEELLRQFDVPVQHVGHPLLDVMVLTMGRAEVFARFGLDPGKKLIGLLPGSRRKEVDALLPVMLRAAELIREREPGVQFVLPRALTVKREQVDRYVAASSVDVKVVDSYRYNVRAAMDFALVASGTATLETGLLLTPMAILYRVAWLTWTLGRMVVKIPHIGLINIVAEREVAPELLQGDCTPEKVAEQALRILQDPERVAAIKRQLQAVKERLGGPGASERAAEIVLKTAA